MVPLRVELRTRDARIAALRAQLRELEAQFAAQFPDGDDEDNDEAPRASQPESSATKKEKEKEAATYDDLEDEVKGERLVLARAKTIEGLKKKIKDVKKLLGVTEEEKGEGDNDEDEGDGRTVAEERAIGLVDEDIADISD